MEIISNTLFWISNGLLVPVIVLLLAFFVRALVMLASFFGEFSARRRNSLRLDGLMECNNASELAERIASSPSSKSRIIITLKDLAAHRDNRAWCERTLANHELDAEKDLAASRSLAKLGPMLGLMGTLIPMGPALVGLAAGDLSSMAYNMQVAFATTVVGMLIAAVGVVTLQVKQRWYAREMNDIEYLGSILSGYEK